MNYNNQFTNDPLTAAQLYSLSLGDGPAGYQQHVEPAPKDTDGISHGNRIDGNQYVNHLPRNTAGPIHGHPLSGLTALDWNTVAVAGVQRVTLDLWDTNPPASKISNTLRRHSLELSYDPNGFDAYFLPWDQTGGAIYMTLGAGANYFFTAALTGCSVMISGTPAAPTVYHCGVGGWPQSPYCRADIYANPDPTGAMSTEVWEDLVAHITHTNQLFPGINTTDYLNDRTPGAPQTTMRSRQMEAALKKKKNDNTAQANPFGAVFGLRDNNGNWSFYLQENVTMKYQKGLWPNEYDAFKCRPLQVTKFFPWQKTYARLWTKF